MSDRMYEAEAKALTDALRAFAAKPENIDNLESYLSCHFGTWLEKYAGTPEGLINELTFFANMD